MTNTNQQDKKNIILKFRATTPAILFSLIAPNIFALLGVLFWKWDLGNLLLFYWADSVVIIFFIFLEILFNQNEEGEIEKMDIGVLPYLGTFWQYKRSTAVFFIIAFGIFSAVHLFFLIFLLVQLETFKNFDIVAFRKDLMFVVASHFFAFILDCIVKRSYLHKTVSQLFRTPIRRIVILHIIIVLSCFILLKASPGKSDALFVLIIFTTIKLIGDLFSLATFKEVDAGKKAGASLPQ